MSELQKWVVPVQLEVEAESLPEALAVAVEVLRGAGVQIEEQGLRALAEVQ